MVDLRVAKVGLVSLMTAAGAEESLSDTTILDLAVAGEAGIVLSLFLASPDVTVLMVPLDEIAVGRAFRAAVLTLEGLALLVVGLSVDFVGLTLPARAPFCLSIDAAVPSVDRRSVDDGSDLIAGERAAVGPIVEIRFANRPIVCFLFSSPELVPGLLMSSDEIADALSRCPEIAAVAAVTLVGGRLPIVLVVGRVGGLLRLLPGVPRETEDVVDMVAGLGVVPARRLAVAKECLDGIPFRRGELGVLWRSSFILTGSSLLGCSSSKGNFSSFSCEGTTSTEVSTPVGDAMFSLDRMS